MRLPQLLALLVLCSGSLALSSAATAEFSGTIDQELVFHRDDYSTEKMETLIEPRLDMDLTESIHLTAIGRIRLDSEGELGFDGGNNHIDTELRELYIDTEWSGLYLRLGKQQIVWGQADGLRVLDVINPLDYREFILTEFEDQRIPLWTANIEIPINDDWTAQLLWIPDQTYDELAQPATNFSFNSPKIVPSLPRETLPADFRVTLAQTDRPGRVVKDSDFGLRLTAFLDGWDVSLNYLYHYQDQPVLFQNRDPNSITINPTYQRTHLIGGSFTNAFGDFTLRGEAGYSTDRYFLAKNVADKDGIVRSAELSYVLGVDYQGWRDWFVSAQVFQSIINESDSHFVRDKVDSSFTALIRRDFLNDTIQAEALLIQNLNDGDGVLQASLEYQWSSDIRFRIGADVFFGSRAGVFGQFSDQDRISLGLEYGF